MVVATGFSSLSFLQEKRIGAWAHLSVDLFQTSSYFMYACWAGKVGRQTETRDRFSSQNVKSVYYLLRIPFIALLADQCFVRWSRFVFGAKTPSPPRFLFLSPTLL